MCIGGGSKQQETAQERELASASLAKWQHQQTLQPYEQAYIAEVQGLQSDEMTEDAHRAAMASAGTGGTSGGIQNMLGRSLQVGAAGQAIAEAPIASKARYLKGMEGVLKMGRDIEAASTKGMTRSMNRGIFSEQASRKARAIKEGAIGEAVGYAAGYGLDKYISRDKNPAGAETAFPDPSKTKMGSLDFEQETFPVNFWGGR